MNHQHEPDTHDVLANTQKPITDFRGLILTLISALVSYGVYSILPYEDMANRGLAILLFVAILWFTEAVHITVTALMVPLLAVMFKIPDMGTKAALSSFADPIIYVFFGGFALAAALNIQKLDRKIAMWVISLSGGNMFVAVMLLFGVTTALSMWISNTATTAMMLPLAMGLMSHLDKEKDRKTYVFVLLGIAYCASIGGLGTIVGSPPNGIAAKALNLDFSGWMKYGLPMMLVLLPLMLISLFVVLKPNFKERVNRTQEENIPWNLHRVITVVIFVTTAIAWIMGDKIQKATGITSIDSFIAIAAAVAVVVFGTVRWKDVAESTDWGVLMLFGGGIALSNLMQKSGASAALGNEVAATFGSAHPLLVIVVVATFIIFLTEFTSNTASAALLVPVFATIAAQLNMPQEVLVMVIGIGASCAFMLPVATPPNAIVFGTGLVKQKDMMYVGFVLNILCIIAVSAWAYWFLM
ncbi:SLC13 family permease [Alysiella filiformis]|uniref:Solute carrier family 13 (Sodium-dependent dicarboxylate transporter), member 2/3/5 n=1 Tax=Alysiella filiformis DSM 16848 TaxID=1120981 RepID=A0A286E3S3_9NEIS|nr:DASS family sodium-coupled anion symporter [Alysiella filiformis]QMT31056.1 DASS family sodium-coupled anion symporter [Alysiella filiformis]UBQ55953.1 DASS family sodium-coupled anion symporter [Alysiella filiformis DSM 16848]SOD65557.1 solute carrier family 13 (sodium-dependent dicarboxylate transporter), member 2/3/5 [Alysiella filiformis DSM 16848]